MSEYRDYAAEFRDELNRSIAIEKVLIKYEVKCRDWIGLVEELNDLSSKVQP